MARADVTGRYGKRGLLPGDYRLAILWDIEFGDWFDPAVIARIDSTSMPISLRAGERKTYDLRVTEPR